MLTFKPKQNDLLSSDDESNFDNFGLFDNLSEFLREDETN